LKKTKRLDEMKSDFLFVIAENGYVSDVVLSSGEIAGESVLEYFIILDK